MKKIKKWLCGIFPILIFLGLMTVSVAVCAADSGTSLPAVTEEGYPVFERHSDAVEYVRECLLTRKTNTEDGEIAFVVPEDLLYPSLRNFLEEAYAHDEEGSGKGGDYLYWNFASYGVRRDWYSDGYALVFVDAPFRTTAEQEEELDAAIKLALQEMNLENATEYEKVRAIHDYICDNVDYYYGSVIPSIKFTAYGALIEGKAVCEGYSVLFYRMCTEAGLSARVISGLAGGPHGWNIVKIGDYYYNVDCTWDGQDKETKHDWFLVNEKDFSGSHTRADKYATEEFMAEYPMAPTSWVSYESYGENLEIENISCEIGVFDGETVTTKAEGRPKVLVLFSASCTSSRDTILSIRDYGDMGADIVAIESNMASSGDVKIYRSTYGGEFIDFAYNGFGALWSYLELGEGLSLNSYPLVVYIDANDVIRYMSAGGVKGKEVANNVAMCKADVDGLSGALELSLQEMEVYVGRSKGVEVTITGTPYAKEFCNWTSSDTNIATVDASGNITGISAGECTINCTLKMGTMEWKDAVKVTVKNGDSGVKVSDVTLNQTALSLKVGDTERLSALTAPENAENPYVVWTSSNPQAVSVDAAGKVTALATGEAVITATAADGGAAESCKVTVAQPVERAYIIEGYKDRHVMVGSEFALEYKVGPENATNKLVRFRTSDESVATVDENGVVKIIKEPDAGYVMIYVEALDGSGRGDMQLVYVYDDPKKFVGLLDNNYNLSLKEGETIQLNIYRATLLKGAPTIYTSSDTSVVTVDEYGVIKGIKSGKATITIKVEDGVINPQIQCEVTVTPGSGNSGTGGGDSTGDGGSGNSGGGDSTGDGGNGNSGGGDSTGDGGSGNSGGGDSTGDSGSGNSGGGDSTGDGGNGNSGGGDTTGDSGSGNSGNGDTTGDGGNDDETQSGDKGENGKTARLDPAADGNWYYYVNDKVDTSYTGLASNEYGWWYVEKGSINFDYNGLIFHADAWWCVVAGQVNFDYTGLWYDPVVGWWYVQNGSINFNYNGLVLFADAWWCVAGGRVAFEYTGLWYDSVVGWWYVQNGSINFNYNGLVLFADAWWCVSGGRVAFEYTGLWSDPIVGWWYVEKGVINFGYTGFVKNEAGVWYVRNGAVDFSYAVG